MAGKVRTVLAGCGGISDTWLRSAPVAEHVQIVGLVDLDEKRAEATAVRYGLNDAIIGTDLAGVLKKTAPKVVFDCTVPEAHFEVTTTALKHGCHVLGEKPMADTVRRARRMVAAARDAGRMYAVMQNRRYLPGIRALRRFILSGRIGHVHTVHCDFFKGAHFGGFRDRMKHVLLLDMAIHTFDAGRFLTGADAERVWCYEWNPIGSWYAHGASAVAVFEMSGGVTYTYRGSWCAEGLNTTWESSWRIIGEKGSVTWDGGEGFAAERVSGTTGFIRKTRRVKVPVRARSDKTVGHSGAIGEFLRCIRTGGVPETVCHDNIKSLAMVHAAIQSARTGRRVAIGAT